MLEHAPLGRLARDGQLGVLRHEGFWMGMDTFRDWKELNSRGTAARRSGRSGRTDPHHLPVG